MLRDGTTGDWIGTFIGHKGAVWSSRLSSDASLAITGSADFTARVWDTFTGECRAILPHNHIVRAVAFAPPPPTEPGQPTQRPQRAATGGSEKRLRVWDISQVSTAPSQQPPTSETAGETTPAGDAPKPLELDASTYATEIAPGAHTGTIKSVIWTSDPDVIITAADDGAIRWFDLRTPDAPVAVHTVVGTIGSCELGDGLVEASTDDTQEGMETRTTGALLSVAAGKRIYVFDAEKKSLVKEIELGGQHEASAVALCGRSRRFVTGAAGDTWVRVWDFDTGKELGMFSFFLLSSLFLFFFSGFILVHPWFWLFSIATTPAYAAFRLSLGVLAPIVGTFVVKSGLICCYVQKLSKAIMAPCGPPHSARTQRSRRRAAKTEPSSCTSFAKSRMGFGGRLWRHPLVQNSKLLQSKPMASIISCVGHLAAHSCVLIHVISCRHEWA